MVENNINILKEKLNENELLISKLRAEISEMRKKENNKVSILEIENSYLKDQVELLNKNSDECDCFEYTVPIWLIKTCFDIDIEYVDKNIYYFKKNELVLQFDFKGKKIYSYKAINKETKKSKIVKNSFYLLKIDKVPQFFYEVFNHENDTVNFFSYKETNF